MTLVDVSTASLKRLRDAIAEGQLKTPLSRTALISFGLRDPLEAVFETLEAYPREACLTILNTVIAERDKHDHPPPELVWTGPEGAGATARDTAVVLRELFESARHRVVLAGYSFRNASTVLKPLHNVMRDFGVEAHFFVDIPQPKTAPEDAELYGRSELSKFVTENWPFGAPYPNVYCDKRALSPGPPWSSLHAKCVVVDGTRAFLSSANFTLRGQDRNIEAGVLIQDTTFGSRLDRQWMGLIDENMVLKNVSCRAAQFDSVRR